MRAQLARMLGQFAAVHAGQANIGHQQVDGAFQVLQQVQGRLTAVGFLDREFQFFEDIDDQHAHDGIVFDD